MSRDYRTGKTEFAYYRKWMAYFLDSDMKIPDDPPTLRYKTGRSYTKTMLWSYCSALASHGTNGLGMYVSDAVIAREIGVGQVKTITRYRHKAIELGWLKRTGKKMGRTEVLDINIPDAIPSNDDADWS